MGLPLGLLLQPARKRPDTGTKKPVSGKGIFRLTDSLILGKLIASHSDQFPVFVPGSTARLLGGFVFSSGW